MYDDFGFSGDKKSFRHDFSINYSWLTKIPISFNHCREARDNSWHWSRLRWAFFSCEFWKKFSWYFYIILFLKVHFLFSKRWRIHIFCVSISFSDLWDLWSVSSLCYQLLFCNSLLWIWYLFDWKYYSLRQLSGESSCDLSHKRS